MAISTLRHLVASLLLRMIPPSCSESALQAQEYVRKFSAAINFNEDVPASIDGARWITRSSAELE